MTIRKLHILHIRHTNNDVLIFARATVLVLLKTALVRVSCIQNTQFRGETIAKVFRKVDTFWTYQSAHGVRHLGEADEGDLLEHGPLAVVGGCHG
jgi:hypothetical protein